MSFSRNLLQSSIDHSTLDWVQYAITEPRLRLILVSTHFEKSISQDWMRWWRIYGQFSCLRSKKFTIAHRSTFTDNICFPSALPKLASWGHRDTTVTDCILFLFHSRTDLVLKNCKLKKYTWFSDSDFDFGTWTLNFLEESLQIFKGTLKITPTKKKPKKNPQPMAIILLIRWLRALQWCLSRIQNRTDSEKV